MRKKVKRVAAGLMTAVMCMSLVACGGSKSNESSNTGDTSSEVAEATEITEVSVCIPTGIDIPDAEKVEAEINKILEVKYSLHMNLSFVAIGNWVQQSNLAMTSDEVDVTAVFQTPLTTYVKNGQLLALDDYVASASDDFKAVWTEEQLQGTTVDGSVYAVPNLRNFGNYFGIYIDETIAEELGIAADSTMTLDDVDAFLRKAHELYPDKYAIVPQQADTMVNGWTWDGLGDNKYIGVITDRGQDTTVQNIFDSEDFQNFCKYSRSWFADGLMMADCLSNTENGQTLVQSGKAISFLSNRGINAPFDGTIYAKILEPWAVANSYSELCYGINANTKNPDASWQMLQLLYTDSEISTLLNDGIEGTHYVKNDDGTISYPEGMDATTCGYGMSDLSWITPYSGNSLPLQANGANYFRDLVEFNYSCLNSKALGFSFDTTDVTDQYSACSNIMDKYYKALLLGAVDTESTIQQADEELKQANIDDIIKAKQEQLDAYLNSK